MARVCLTGDQISGTCNHSSHPGLSVTGTWGQGSTKTRTADGSKGTIRVGDTGVASCGHTFFAVTGSSKFTIGGAAVHRIGDEVNIQGGYGTSTSSSSVMDSLT